ncbi:nicotinate-nucleotide adenylyltransferase [Cyanobacterium stanieri LEGE 03274]|uniref:nicotinate-nucleotide adenylyltransferase n=1 Tax=Cyanobacterium stanieri LEGE 03274 TaxID=1828756 RepID=A0ABR9V085_9CHRO|nr:nicotinate-nucleotide adenylyltransferase [Cyanobacterium stanieri]MBE9221285.1 nicotinate-nucleotide adenylyltransferase [Cyanobacterium stanieri LEGE 03274]
MKIAIFGTSADPPTIAHKTILDYLSQKYDLIAVYASDNPFKESQKSLYHRTKMLALLIEELNQESINNNVELATDIGDRRTIYTIEKAKKKWGQKADLTFVIGSDLAPQIFSWYEAKKLWSQVKVLILPRQGYTIDIATQKKLDQFTLGYTLAEYPLPPVSSTEYRQSQNEEILSPKVKSYIQTHNLYTIDPAD